MSPVCWLVLVGCQACLWPLHALPRPEERRGAARIAPPAAGRSGPRRQGPPGRGEARPPAPAVQGARNLVLEVRRIELDDANGAPRGTYR